MANKKKPLGYDERGMPIWARNAAGKPVCNRKINNRDAYCQCEVLDPRTGRCRAVGHGGFVHSKRTKKATPYDTAQQELERRFAAEFCVDFDPPAAAIRCGIERRRAQAAAARLLASENVRKIVEEHRRQLADRTLVTNERIEKEFARIAFADARSFVEWSNSQVSLIASEQLSADDAAAVAEVSNTQHGIKIKFHSKDAALNGLARMRGLFIDKVEHVVSDESLLSAMVDALAEKGMTEEEIAQIVDAAGKKIDGVATGSSARASKAAS